MFFNRLTQFFTSSEGGGSQEKNCSLVGGEGNLFGGGGVSIGPSDFGSVSVINYNFFIFRNLTRVEAQKLYLTH